MLGWCLGVNVDDPVSLLDQGILVYRDAGSDTIASSLKNRDPKEWFLHPEHFADPMGKPYKKSPRYKIEIRDGDMYGVDVVEMIIQTAHILETGEAISDPRLKYKIYNELNKLGIHRPELFGLGDAEAIIERELILPLAHLKNRNQYL